MKLTLTLFFIFFNLSIVLNAQTPGIIVRPAGTAGPGVLDPNLNGYTSIATSGFGNNDITNSEIPYKIIAPLVAEPTGDLLRGPAGKFSDIVKTFDGSGFYLFTNGTNLLCRLRIGGIVSGSKGYSILLDTDQKFGPSGPSADLNFQAATNGNNGNPGFEYEVVLETNFRIAIYSVDGTSTPVLLASYSLATNSQISVAATTDGGDPDYFYDFYVPYTAMGITALTPIRAIATTVMSPGPAIGGPKSDIYGLSGTDYMADWITFITKQPVFTVDSLKLTGSGVPAVCTDAPTVNGPISPSAITVTGTWTRSSYSSITTATITLFNGSTASGTTTVSSGGTWSIAVSGLVDNNIISARAKGNGESQCLSSNEIIVSSCNNATHTVSPVIDPCSSDRGFMGTMVAGARVKLYRLTSIGYSLYADDATTTYLITYPTTTTWRYDDINTQSGLACTGGAADVPVGAYIATAQVLSSCASLPVTVCITGNGMGATPSTPTVSSLLLEGATSITGTALANSGVNLFIDGYFVQSVVASTGGVFNFTFPKKLFLNQTIEINNATTGSCASTSFTATVSCYVAAPVINTNASKQIAIGSQIGGTSPAPTGSTVNVYNAASLVSVGTTTVQSNGTWLLASPTAVAATNYLARITGSVCGNSRYSDTAFTVTGTASTRCGTITSPIAENATSVAGTVTGSVAATTVTLFVDGISVGSQVIAGTAWSIPVNNTIYAGAVLTISIAESNKTEILCAASQTVNCTSPSAPSISPTNTTISAGQTVTYTLSSTTSGLLYSIRDNADATNVGESKFGNSSTVTVTTDPFNTPGTYTVKIKATSFSGANCITTSNALVVVTGVLPLSLTKFTGTKQNGSIKLNWQTDFEQSIRYYEVQKSNNGVDFKKIGIVNAVGNSIVSQSYFYDDAEMLGNIFYYRLKIVEDNGTSKLSKIVIFRSDKGIITSTISPNPFYSFMNVDFETDNAQNIIIRFYDMMGRTVKNITLNARKGNNTFKVLAPEALPGGSYIIEMIAGGERVFKDILIKK